MSFDDCSIPSLLSVLACSVPLLMLLRRFVWNVGVTSVFFLVSCPGIRSYMCFLLHERPHADIFQWRPWNPWTPLQQCSARVKGPLFCPPPPVSSTSNLLPTAMSLSQCIGRDRMVIDAGAQDFFHQVPSQIWKIDVLHIFPKYFTLCYQEWIA